MKPDIWGSVSLYFFCNCAQSWVSKTRRVAQGLDIKAWLPSSWDAGMIWAKSSQDWDDIILDWDDLPRGRPPSAAATQAHASLELGCWDDGMITGMMGSSDDFNQEVNGPEKVGAPVSPGPSFSAPSTSWLKSSDDPDIPVINLSS